MSLPLKRTATTLPCETSVAENQHACIHWRTRPILLEDELSSLQGTPVSNFVTEARLRFH